MAAFLLVPLFEAIGIELATVLEGYVASSVVAAGSAYLGNKAAEAVDEKVKNKVLEQVPDWAKNLPAEVQEDLTNVMSYLNTKDPSKLLEKARKQEEGTYEPPVINKDGAIVPGSSVLADTARGVSGTQPGQGLVIKRREGKEVIPATTTAEDLAQLPEVSGVDENIPGIEKEVNHAEIPEQAPSDIPNPNAEPFFEEEEIPIATIVDELTEPVDLLDNIYDRQQYGPRDLARMLINTSRELAKTLNPVQSTMTVLETNPQSIGLFAKVSAYMASKSLPNTEEYRRVSQVYNGRNIDFSNFSIARNRSTRLIEVTGVDETGTSFTLPQTTGVVLPAVPGTVFMGPLSANDRLPTFDRVEDFFSFFHDYSWKDGNFNREGDLKFISRLSQNMDRVKPEHRALVSSTIVYFTNVSLSLGLLKGEKEFGTAEITTEGEEDEKLMINRRSIPYAEIVEDTTENEGDIFDVLGGVEDFPPALREKARKEFYDVLQEEMTNYQKTEGFFTTYRENYVETLIDTMEIQYN